MKNNSGRNNSDEPNEAEAYGYEDIDTPDFSLTHLAKFLGEGAVANAEFIEKNFPNVLYLFEELSNEMLEEKLAGCGETIFAMVLDMGYFQFSGLVDDLLSGNIPAGYASMRTILESVVDSVIACTKFSDYPFPKNLEMLQQLEHKERVRISKKCSSMLPEEISKQTRDKIRNLYSYLSSSWVHPKGTAKKYKEGNQIPGWPFIPPVKYENCDKVGLSEFFEKLHELKECIHELLQSAIKLSAK